MIKPRARTFETVLRESGGIGLGFDVLRIGLAVAILVSHMSHIANHSGTTAAFANWIGHVGGGAVPARHSQNLLLRAPVNTNGLSSMSGPVIRALVPMFFALSGFLVAGSALRAQSLKKFLGLRVIRIIPALFVEVTLSAIFLGAVFTTLPIGKYYTSRGFFEYFQNILGIVHFRLPGVFEHNPTAAVNSNLWTLPFELECYIVMSALILLGALRARVTLTAVFAACSAILLVWSLKTGTYTTELDVYPGRVLIYYFCCGLLLFIWRDRIIYSNVAFIVCAIASYFLLRTTFATFVVPLFLTYVTIFFGLIKFPQFRLLKSGDYSYGVYLYGYPVSQAVVTTLGAKTISYWVLVALCLSATCAFAFLSWHGVEKHFMKLKPYLSKRSAKMTEDLHPEIRQS